MRNTGKNTSSPERECDKRRNGEWIGNDHNIGLLRTTVWVGRVIRPLIACVGNEKIFMETLDGQSKMVVPRSCSASGKA